LVFVWPPKIFRYISGFFKSKTWVPSSLALPGYFSSEGGHKGTNPEIVAGFAVEIAKSPHIQYRRIHSLK
jgi:hypothetical protein